MFKTAFSTVACPDWTLQRVANAASQHGFDGVELRSFGSGSRDFACDPALTSAEKVKDILFAAGVQPAVLGTSVSFDEPISPPVLGRIFGDFERPVRLAKSAINLAEAIKCPYVRVYGFELLRSEHRKLGIARIVERLQLVVDAARHSGVRLVLENGGSFATAPRLLEILDRVSSPLLGAAYSLPVAVAAGEDPLEGIRLLGPRLWVAKVKDLKADGTPCQLGEGDLPVADFVRAIQEREERIWLVYEWDRAWIRGLAPPDEVLPDAAQRLYEMADRHRSEQQRGTAEPVVVA
jgi:sugar phosphate isomerase/epimerase